MRISAAARRVSAGEGGASARAIDARAVQRKGSVRKRRRTTYIDIKGIDKDASLPFSGMATVASRRHGRALLFGMELRENAEILERRRVALDFAGG